MATRLFHALVVAGSSMATGAALEGCGAPPLQVPDGGAGWGQIAVPDAAWAIIDLATGDLRDAAWWPDIHIPFFPDFMVQDLRWWPDIGMPIDLGRYDWIIIDMAPPRG